MIRIQEQIPTDSQPNLDVENINIKNSLNDDKEYNYEVESQDYADKMNLMGKNEESIDDEEFFVQADQ